MLYAVRQEGDRWIFVPSRIFAASMVGMFSGGSLLMLYLSKIFFRHMGQVSADFWIGVIFVLIGGYPASLAIRAWRTRRTPLTIDGKGRVAYGEQELCPAGTVRAVRISKSRSGEANDHEVSLQLAEGKLAFLPSRYFPGFATRAQARPFAAKLAEVLKVQVIE
jgi:hypothetical protein